MNPKKPSLPVMIALALCAMGLLGGLATFYSTPALLEDAAPEFSKGVHVGLPTSATKAGEGSPVLVALNKPEVLPKSVPSSSSMAERFGRATSLRAFFYEAIRAPESGGYFYGLAALGSCKNYSGMAPIPANASHAQQNAIRSLALRCEMTDQDRRAGYSQLFHEKNTHGHSDPVLQRVSDLVGAKSQAERRNAMVGLLELQDAAMLVTLLSPVDHGEKSETFFKGNWYAGEKGEQTIEMAILLARCALGANCGADSTENLNVCAQRGWCGANVTESILQGIGAVGIDFAATQALANQMVTTFKQQDVSAFVAPVDK